MYCIDRHGVSETRGTCRGPLMKIYQTNPAEIRLIVDQYGLPTLNRNTKAWWSVQFILKGKNTDNENAGALARPPATCPLCQYSCPKVVKGCQDVMMTYHDVMPWCHMTSGVMTNWFDAVTTCHMASRRHAMTSRDVMMSFCDVMTSFCDITWGQVSWQNGSVHST